MQELREERAKYNVNHLGYYQGGLPQFNKGPIRRSIRGDSLGDPGNFHQPQLHNLLNNYHPDSTLVTAEDAVKFKAYMTSDKADFTMSKPHHVMHYDRDFNFLKDRSFWFCTLLILFGAMYSWGKYNIESARWRRWTREYCLED